jgi:hypothetical protein
MIRIFGNVASHCDLNSAIVSKREWLWCDKQNPRIMREPSVVIVLSQQAVAVWALAVTDIVILELTLSPERSWKTKLLRGHCVLLPATRRMGLTTRNSCGRVPSLFYPCFHWGQGLHRTTSRTLICCPTQVYRHMWIHKPSSRILIWWPPSSPINTILFTHSYYNREKIDYNFWLRRH